MIKAVSATELHQKLGELLDGVYQIEVYDERLQQREHAFSVLDRIWEKVPNVSEEEAQADIEAAIAEVRTEKTRKKGDREEWSKK